MNKDAINKANKKDTRYDILPIGDFIKKYNSIEKLKIESIILLGILLNKYLFVLLDIEKKFLDSILINPLIKILFVVAKITKILYI